MADKEECPYYVFIRYNSNLHENCTNSLSKGKHVQKNYNGRVLGYADEISCLEGCWPTRKGMVLLQFDSMRNAEHWVRSDPEIKQYDWLSGVDIIGVPGKQTFCPSVPYVQLMDVTMTNSEEFMSCFVPKAKGFLEKNKVRAGVVFSTDVKKIRGKWEPPFLIVHQYKNGEHLQSTHANGSEDIQAMRRNTSQTTMITFNLKFK